MIPLTPDLLIAAAGPFVGLREEGGSNRGLMIDLFLRGVSQPVGKPWCAAFVYHVGHWSHMDYETNESSWPLPATASCWVLGDFARSKGILREEPAVGDVFLLWSALHGRFAHTGVIVDLLDQGQTPGGRRWFDCHTIEGNTNAEGGREGTAVLRRTRRFCPASGDRFIRWCALDPRSGAEAGRGRAA